MSKTDPKKTNISEKLAQLDSEVEWFYGEDFSVDQALEKYQHASALAQKIAADLDQLKNQVEVLEDFTKS